MRRTAIIFLTVIPFLLTAQEIKQDIFIYDKKQMPISDINLYYIVSKDTIALKTDVHGKFTVQGKNNEVAKVVVNHHQYSYFEEEFKISPQPKSIFLEKVFSLDEITIKAKKQNISRAFGTTTLNIDDSPIFQNSTFKDAIMLIPEVNIVNENVKILGKNKTLYLINGRESNRNINDLLANQIEKIEVISNPSAKYQANYDSVINIVLKKNQNNGWYFNLNSNTYINRLTSYFNAVDVGVNLKKWSIESSVRYNFDNGLVFSNGWQNYQDKLEDYHTRFKVNKQYLETSTHINYNIGKNSNVGIDFSYGKYPKYNSISSSESKFNYFHTNENERIHSVSNSGVESQFINTSVYYNFSKEKNNLNMYVSYIRRNQDFNNNITSNRENIPLLNQNILSNNNSNTLIFNSDYEFKFNEKNKLDIGFRASNFKGKYHLNAIHFNTPLSSTLFDFTENIYSSYGIYKFNVQKLSFSTGLRYEYFNRDVIYNNAQKSKINQGNIFPSLYIGYKSENKNNALSFSYSKKIQRPNFNDITPFEYNVNYNTIFRGNPNLKNEFIHSVQMQYAYKSKLFLTTHYNYYQNYIEQVTTFENNNLVWFPTNYKVNNVGTSLMYNFSAVKNKLKLYNKLTVEYNENIGNVNDVSLNTSLWQWNLYLAQVYSINKKTGISLITNYYSPQLSDFYKIRQGLRTDIKLSTKLFKDRVETSVRINDVFNTYFNELKGNYNGFESFRYSDFSTRSIIFSLRYNFHSGKKVKSKPIHIDNSEEENRTNK